jgi:hypothetical protein
MVSIPIIQEFSRLQSGLSRVFETAEVRRTASNRNQTTLILRPASKDIRERRQYHERNYPVYLRESQAASELRNDPRLKDVTLKLSAAYARDGEPGFLNAEFAVQESCSPSVYPGAYRFTRKEKAIKCLNRGTRPEALQLLEEASASHEQDFEDFRAEFASGSSRDLHEQFSPLAHDPRFQAPLNQKADLPKAAKLPASPDSGTL